MSSVRPQLDAMLSQGEPEAAGIVHGAIEDFSQGFAGGYKPFLDPNGMEGHRAYRHWRWIPR
jgi:hypothetical protein